MSNDFIRFLVENGALQFGTFTLKSGRIAPYFVNTGKLCERETTHALGRFYGKLIDASEVEFDVLFGPAYKGIPLAATATPRHNVKLSYNRKEVKDHGDAGVWLGYTPKAGDRVAIIDDVITDGKAKREAIELLSSVGAEVVAMYVSIDRMERGTDGISAVQQFKRDYGINVYSLATVKDIIAYLETAKHILDGKQHADNIRKYLQEYGA